MSLFVSRSGSSPAEQIKEHCSAICDNVRYPAPRDLLLKNPFIYFENVKTCQENAKKIIQTVTRENPVKNSDGIILSTASLYRDLICVAKLLRVTAGNIEDRVYSIKNKTITPSVPTEEQEKYKIIIDQLVSEQNNLLRLRDDLIQIAKIVVLRPHHTCTETRTQGSNDTSTPRSYAPRDRGDEKASLLYKKSV